jgi:hypothetical protein
METTDRILSPLEFLDEDDVEYELIDGFKKGEKLRIRSLTAGDIIEWAEASEANEKELKRTAGLRLIVRSLVDENGHRQLTEVQHLEALRKKNHALTNRVVSAILKHNGMDPKKPDKAVEEAKKD